MVPEGWSSHPVSYFGEVQAGRQRSPKFTKGDLRPYLRVANVFDGYIDTSNVLEMPFSDAEHQRYRLRSRDILLNEGQSLELVGRPSMYRGEPRDCCFQNTLVRFRPNKKVCSLFALYRFQQCLYDGTFQKIAKKTTSIAHLGVSRFANLKLSWPPLLEQQKIARILSTWDKAIATVEKLLENSKAQKKALMQQLLTGKRRLPGFTETWRENKLKALAKIFVSNVDKKTLPGEKSIRLCNYTDVYYNDYITDSLSFMKATAKRQEIEKFKLLPGDVIITKDSETPEDIAVPAVVSETLNGVVCGYHLAIIRPQQELVDSLFLSKLLSIPSVRHYFFSLANGVTRFGLTTDAIVNAKLLVPTLPEQRRIGEVLQTLDRRIENQTKQRDALKQQKKSLMQQLLTGKRRVKIEPESEGKGK